MSEKKTGKRPVLDKAMFEAIESCIKAIEAGKTTLGLIPAVDTDGKSRGALLAFSYKVCTPVASNSKADEPSAVVVSVPWPILMAFAESVVKCTFDYAPEVAMKAVVERVGKMQAESEHRVGNA